MYNLHVARAQTKQSKETIKDSACLADVLIYFSVMFLPVIVIVIDIFFVAKELKIAKLIADTRKKLQGATGPVQDTST